MKIAGVGIISKAKAMETLTEEGRKAVRSGDITIESLEICTSLDKLKKLQKSGIVEALLMLAINGSQAT